jgi:hypothetical protein
MNQVLQLWIMRWLHPCAHVPPGPALSWWPGSVWVRARPGRTNAHIGGAGDGTIAPSDRLK